LAFSLGNFDAYLLLGLRTISA